ncbi:MAG: hypothetical protein Q7U36_01160 [bacterium]|nr:hypothetical protein [bacterium]
MRLKINKNLLILLFPIITLLLVLSSQKASAATCTWSGGSTAWALDSNWSCGHTPIAEDDVGLH